MITSTLRPASIFSQGYRSDDTEQSLLSAPDPALLMAANRRLRSGTTVTIPRFATACRHLHFL